VRNQKKEAEARVLREMKIREAVEIVVQSVNVKEIELDEENAAVAQEMDAIVVHRSEKEVVALIMEEIGIEAVKETEIREERGVEVLVEMDGREKETEEEATIAEEVQREEVKKVRME
jgi:hypothetical protein